MKIDTNFIVETSLYNIQNSNNINSSIETSLYDIEKPFLKFKKKYCFNWNAILWQINYRAIASRKIK